MQHANYPTFTIEEIAITPSTNQILLAGQSRRIEPKLMALLCLLHQNRNTLVSRNQIIAHLWPDQVVTEESVNRVIFNLRAELNEKQRKQKLIETIPKMGYLLRVEESQPIIQNLLSTPKLWFAICVTLALLLVIILAITPDNKALEVKQISNFTSDEGAETSISFSPNERYALYNYHQHIFERGPTKLLLHDFETNTTAELAHQDPDKYFISSLLWLDNKSFTYSRCTMTIVQCEIVKRSLDGEIKVLSTLPEDMFAFEFIKFKRNTILITMLKKNSDPKLFTLNLDTGKRSPLVFDNHPLPQQTIYPSYNPAQQSLYFFSQSEGNLLSKHVETGETEILSEAFSHINSTLYLENKEALLVSGFQNENYGLWRIDIDTGEHTPIIINVSGGEIHDLAYRASSQSLYYSFFRLNMDLAGYQYDTHSFVNFSDINSIEFESWAKNNSSHQKMLLTSKRSGDISLLSYDTATKKLSNVAKIKTPQLDSPLLSNKGNLIAAIAKKAKFSLLIVNSVTGEIAQEIELNENAYIVNWSQDDHRLYLVSRKRELLEYNLINQTIKVLAQNAGYAAQRNEQSISYLDIIQNNIVELDLKSNSKKVVRTIDYSLDTLMPAYAHFLDSSLYFVGVEQSANMPSKQYLYRYSITDPSLDQKIELSALPLGIYVTDIDSKQQRILFTKDSGLQSNLIQMQFK